MATYKLDLSKRSDEILKFEESLKKSVIGQDEAVDEVIKVYQSYLAGMKTPHKPLGNFLFLGPTGVGKTLLVESVANVVKSDLIKINCAEYSDTHHTNNLTGSPLGYVNRDDDPVITQKKLDKNKPSVVLFDEIEKSSHTLWNLLLGITDKAELNTNKGSVDFSQSFIFFTSNVGSDELSRLHSGLGFNNTVVENDKIKSISTSALAKKFPPEFVNRMDSIVVFNSLSEQNIRKILSVETGLVQGRILLSDTPFVVYYTESAREFLSKDGYDPKYGARHLKRTIERNIVSPLTIFMSSKQVGFGDLVTVDYKNNEFDFEVTVAGAVSAVVAAKENIRAMMEEKEVKSRKKRLEFVNPGV